MSPRRLRRLTACVAAICVAVCLTSCGSAATRSDPDRSLTVLELGSTYGAWNSLDPITNQTAGINHDFMNAIYGELFQRAPDGRIAPDLATRYRTSPNQRTIRISLRHGVRFSDGSPFNAGAVVFNLRRDLAKPAACSCLQNFSAVSAITAAGQTTVVMHLSHPDPSIIYAFIDAPPNWIVSPTSLRRMGTRAFGLHPVGAGPFKVVDDVLNSRLTLTKNPTYWERGRPLLDSLTFLSVNDDQTAYDAMLAGQAQVYMDFGTPTLLAQMRSHFDTIPQPATETEAVNLNPTSAPFRSLLAREAIYYATDPQSINAHIFGSAGHISQAPGGPGDLFWNPKVAGYRRYDPARARQIVKRLGGLSFTLTTLNTPIQLPIVEALQSQWRQVGINAHLAVLTIPQAVKATQEGRVQALDTQVGSYDPSLLPGIAASYASTGPFSLVKDPVLDGLIARAGMQPNQAAAGHRYQGISDYLSRRAYAPYLFTASLWNVVDRSVTGIDPGTPEVAWQDVARTG
jgi:peptide/nickel transport system substrate-binding protein